MAVPFIAAYKAGDSDVTSHITDEKVIYWYRQNIKSLDCDATDTTTVTANNTSGNYFEGRPDGADDMHDSVFVITLLKDDANLLVTSGNNTQTFDAKADANAFTVPMGLGKQSFSVNRNGAAVDGLSGDSLKTSLMCARAASTTSVPMWARCRLESLIRLVRMGWLR